LRVDRDIGRHGELGARARNFEFWHEAASSRRALSVALS
jgi:hypothetical protein